MPGPFVLAAYTKESSAIAHARCITSATAVRCELLEQTSPEIVVDIQVDEQGGQGYDSENWDDADTLVQSLD